MPYSITTKDGITLQNIPDDIAPDAPELRDRVAKIRGSRGGLEAPAPKPTLGQAVQASVPGRILQGMRDPIDAGAQLLTHALPDSVVDAGNSLNNWLAENTGLVGKLPERNLSSLVTGQTASGVDVMNAENERRYQEARKAAGQDGADVARFVGNVASPTNVALAYAAPIKAGMSAMQLAKTGAAVGAAGGALTPVNMGEEGDFWPAKAAQVGFGAAGGAALTPGLDRAGRAVINRLMPRSGAAAGVQASMATDEAINKMLADLNITIDQLPSGYAQEVRQQVREALKKGQKLDAAELIRIKDFKSLGITPLKGQISRDPTQYALEQNLRATEQGVPIMNRLTEQNQALQARVGAMGGNQAMEAQQAGGALEAALKQADERMRQAVSAAYQKARKDSGKDLDVPLQGLAQDYAAVLRDFGDKVPSGVRNNLDALGLLSGTQKKTFSVEDAERVLQVINDNQSTDPAVNTALAKLRNAVKDAVLGADDKGGVFAGARKLAAARFELQDSVAALKAASRDQLNADKFVEKYLINGQTKDVRNLADFLGKASPEAAQEARNQVGAYLQRAAFGENTAGDKIFTPERFAKAIRALGTEKLRIFYSPQEVANLMAVSRVGAYINSRPSGSPVLGNPNMAWAGRMLERLPGGAMTVSLAGTGINMARRGNQVTNALRAAPTKQAAELTPEQLRVMSRLLSAGAGGAGVLGADPFR